MTTRDELLKDPLLRVVIALIGGMLTAYHTFGSLPVSTTGWMLAVVVSALVTLLLTRFPIAQGAMICVSAFLFGAFLMQRTMVAMSAPLPTETARWRAVVATEPVRKGKTVRFDAFLLPAADVTSSTNDASRIPADDNVASNNDASRISAETTSKRSPRPMKVKASAYCQEGSPIPFHAGETIDIEAALKEPADYADRHFSYRRWMLTQGYRAQVFIAGGRWQKARGGLRWLPRVERIRIKLEVQRHRLVTRYAALGLQSADLALVSALTLGDKSMLSRETKEAFSMSGASHVLALSGLHLGIIFSFLILVVCRGNRHSRWVPLIAVTVWTYVLLVGMPASAVRSAVMLTLLMMATSLHRSSRPYNTLAFAAMCIIVASPLSLFDTGFQMSFLAVLAIALLYKPLERLFPQRWMAWRPARWLCQMAAVSVAAQAGVVPIVAYCFGRFSCYFLLTNCIAIPLTTLLLWCAVLMLLLTPLPMGQQVVAWAMEGTARLLGDTQAMIAGIPGSHIENININFVQVVLCYVLLGIAVVLVRRFTISACHTCQYTTAAKSSRGSAISRMRQALRRLRGSGR